MRRVMLGLVAAVATVGLALGCGKKGPPLAPIQIVSTPISDLTARRLGSTVYLQFRIPTRNVIGDGPADVERVEVYAFTGEPIEQPAGTPLDDEDFLEYATLIDSRDVRPPPRPADEGEEGDAPDEPTAAEAARLLLDDRPAQGDLVTVTEELTPETMEPVEVESRRRRDDDEPRLVVLPAFWPTTDPELSRYYVAVARNRKNQASAASTRVRIPLDPPPVPPSEVVLVYGASDIVVMWDEPAGVPQLIQEPPVAAPATPPGTATEPTPLMATPVVTQRALHTYNLYDPNAIPNAVGLVAPINPTPLTVRTFTDPRVTFGVERCYVVHTVASYGAISVESEPSVRRCVTPTDTFRPAAPTRLVAVASQGAISLLWEPNDEPDLAGYRVLRGEAPAEVLEPLTTALVPESTFRDASVTPGVSYVYAVVAVDDATPPNASPESNRVQETAR